ncbi:MAG TPA: response regulator [Elusimicrobiota bacterium]|nr:response regulator [Elusimicrobiota bacterium]
MTDPGKLIELDVKPRSRIIVADDEQDIATLIEDWLSDTYEVTVALNGKAAIQKAIWQRPDVILCDIVMPDMGGYEVARALQANPTTQGVPMIVMTAKNYDDSTVRMIKAEPNVLGFINKPFKPSELIKMIQSVMSGQRTFQATAPSPASETPSLVVRAPATTPEAPPRSAVGAVPSPTSYETRLAARVEDRSESRISPGATAVPSSVFASGGRTAPPAFRGLPSDDEPSGDRPSGFRRGIKALWGAVWRLALLGLGLGLFGEVLCRWTEGAIGEPVFLPPLRAARYKELPYQFEPNAQWASDGLVFRVNSWGLRDRDFPLVAPPDTYRVLLLGGTAAFGARTADNDTLARQLENALRAAGVRSGQTIQVINATHWAYSPADQWAYVEKEGFQFRPQIIAWIVEPRSADLPSGRGLRELALWYGLARGPLAQSRFVSVVGLRIASFFGESREPALEDLVKKAQAFSKSQGVRLLLWSSSGFPTAPGGAVRLAFGGAGLPSLPSDAAARVTAGVVAAMRGDASTAAAGS